MTKMIKLSLAAAVAVSALSTTATAGSLEDSIKDTTISGKILVGYNFSSEKASGNDETTNNSEYDIDLTLNTKVNDTITAQVGFQADNDSDNRDDTTVSPSVTLTKLNFTAKTDVATVIVGKQKQPTPFFDDERGDGVVALVPAGPVTIAAGHFTGLNSKLDLAADTDGSNFNIGERDVSALAVIGTFGPVNASLWYATLSGAENGAVVAASLEDGATAYSLNLAGKFGPVNVDFTHSSAELENETTSDYDNEDLTKLIVSSTVAGVNLVAGYGFTNDNDKLTTITRNHGVDLTDDNDAKTNFVLDQIKLDKYNDADALLVGASMTFGQTTVGANYLAATIDGATAGDAKTKGKELDLTVKYAMSKNFSITGLYADTEIKSDGVKSQDSTHMELSLNYKF